MSKKVKGTFVCPTYNCAGYIAETIDSIRKQTIPDWELIVVDDGSTDTTEMLMNYYTKEDKRIKYIRFEENKGPIAARNAGNTCAESPLIMVIDHDDLCSSKRLAITLAHFKKHPDTDIFHGAWYEVDVRRNPMSDRYKPMKITRTGYDANKILFCHSTAAYPTEIALKYPYEDYVRPDGSNIAHKTDDLMALDIWLKAGLKFRTTNNILCAVRRLPTGQMQQIRAAKGLPPSWRE